MSNPKTLSRGTLRLIDVMKRKQAKRIAREDGPKSKPMLPRPDGGPALERWREEHGVRRSASGVVG